MWTAMTACRDGTTKKAGEDEPEEKAGHDQDDVEDGRERLAVQQQAKRGNEDCEQVDHWP